MLNTDSPIPLYHQLAEVLTQRIRSGVYSPGQVIPSETGLAKQYGIGRPTVRQAMDLLVKKDLIQRRRGAGTFVKQPPPRVDLFSLAGTSQAFSTKGIAVEKQIVSPMALKNINGDIQNPFNGKTAFFLSRLTLAKEDPVLLEEIFMDTEIFAGIEKFDFKGISLSRVVADQYYLSPENGFQQFKVETADPYRAGLLKLSFKDQVLVVRRELNFPNAPGAVFSTLYCRTDTFAFSQTIQAEK